MEIFIICFISLMQEEINSWLDYYPRRMSNGLVKDCLANSKRKGVILVPTRSLKDWWKKDGNYSSDRYRWIRLPGIRKALVYCTRSEFPSYDDGGPFYEMPGESTYCSDPTRMEHSHYYTHSPFVKGEREIIDDVLTDELRRL